MKPPFGWAGSKMRCKEEIINEFPIVFGDYYEPFMGGCSAGLNLVCHKRIFKNLHLSDSNKHLVNCFRAIKDEPERVKKVLLNCLEKNSEEFYYEMRRNVANPSVFIYLMRACFSSLYRENQKGEFNTPYRKHDFIVMKRKIGMEVDSIDRCSEYLNKWNATIQCCDWEKGLTGVNSGDVVYLDPVYIPYTETGFVNYQKGGFNLDNHVYLNNYAKQLAIKGAHVFLSNSYTPMTVKIFGEPHKILNIGDSINANAVEKGKRLEGLWVYK
jgi:DNA adenine methylase